MALVLAAGVNLVKPTWPLRSLFVIGYLPILIWIGTAYTAANVSTLSKSLANLVLEPVLVAVGTVAIMLAGTAGRSQQDSARTYFVITLLAAAGFAVFIALYFPSLPE